MLSESFVRPGALVLSALTVDVLARSGHLGKKGVDAVFRARSGLVWGCRLPTLAHDLYAAFWALWIRAGTYEAVRDRHGCAQPSLAGMARETSSPAPRCARRSTLQCSRLLTIAKQCITGSVELRHIPGPLFPKSKAMDDGRPAGLEGIHSMCGSLIPASLSLATQTQSSSSASQYHRYEVEIHQTSACF